MFRFIQQSIVKIKMTAHSKKISLPDLTALTEKAISLREQKKYLKSLQLFNKVLDAENLDKDSIACATMHKETGDTYYELKEYAKAFEHHSIALDLYLQNKELDNYLEQLKRMGTMQQAVWQYPKAQELFQQGLNTAVRMGSMKSIVEFEILLGNCFNWADKFEEAERYLKSAIQKEQHIRMPVFEIRAKVSYAILLRKMKKYDEAEKYFKIGYKLSKENGNIMFMDITKSYGIMHYELGNYDTALSLLSESIKSKEIREKPIVKAVINEYLSLVYETKGDYKNALKHARDFYEARMTLIEQGFSDENNKLQAKIGLNDARREQHIAEETAQAKSLFIATISHEIRTPMNIILSTTALMQNDHPKPEHIKYLDTLRRSGENLLGIINDILDISKIEAGKLEIEYEPVVLQDVFENIYQTMLQPAKDKNLKLFYTLDNKLTFPIYSDALRLTQIITNLISNSIKFTAKGEIHFQAKIKNKNTLFLQIHDTGIGIPKDKLPTIFDQYEQVRTQVQKKYKGTGLGLAICKKLVEMMNGQISIKSKVNEGTCFCIELPFQKAKIQQTKASTIQPFEDTSFLADKHILIADDFEDNRFVFKETLRLFNPTVRISEAENGSLALDFCKTTSDIDLIIMDLDMPEMNGFEALTEIRKLKKHKKTKVIASTASLVSNQEDEFIAFGYSGFLPKPFTLEILYNILRKQFNA
ncbi:MAG TPA: ATP-binding protein [Chitinophagales bacterium]|nr:ATP-binding protein [Chitinophagales bacterium]